MTAKKAGMEREGEEKLRRESPERKISLVRHIGFGGMILHLTSFTNFPKQISIVTSDRHHLSNCLL